jgi:hypothetical protein
VASAAANTPKQATPSRSVHNDALTGRTLNKTPEEPTMKLSKTFIEVVPTATWEVYDDARPVAVFYDEREAREYAAALMARKQQ